MTNHASDCALHNGPAYIPHPCDCGADPSMTPEKYGSEQPTGVRLHLRPPVKGEEGYGIYQWLCEQNKPILSVPTDDMANAAQLIIDDLWKQWYGEHKGTPTVDQMAAILTGTKVRIMHAMLDNANNTEQSI